MRLSSGPGGFPAARPAPLGRSLAVTIVNEILNSVGRLFPAHMSNPVKSETRRFPPPRCDALVVFGYRREGCVRVSSRYASVFRLNVCNVGPGVWFGSRPPARSHTADTPAICCLCVMTPSFW